MCQSGSKELLWRQAKPLSSAALSSLSFLPTPCSGCVGLLVASSTVWATLSTRPSAEGHPLCLETPLLPSLLGWLYSSVTSCITCYSPSKSKPSIMVRNFYLQKLLWVLFYLFVSYFSFSLDCKFHA